MNLIDRFCGVFFRRPVIRAERNIWAAARTLDDLGRLTARWLTGDLKSQPGYYGPVDVDEDDAPGMTTALVACNRAGFVTHNSQAGFDGTGYDGAHWHQHAAVVGFADGRTVTRLRTALAGTRFQLMARPVAARFGRRLDGVAVTWRAGVPFTLFGGQLRKADLDGIYGDACHPDLIDALCDAWQVTIFDPQPGANNLWPVLRAAHGPADRRLTDTTR